MKIYVIAGAIIAAIVFGIGGVKEAMDYQYQKGYAAGADSLSDKHVSEVCIQWLFQSNLEQAKRKVCAK